jgi:hypothetical protein
MVRSGYQADEVTFRIGFQRRIWIYSFCWILIRRYGFGCVGSEYDPVGVGLIFFF